jgi:Fe-S cluster assembly protein SufD
MSVAAAIRTRDVGELPSRRDEDWRWTDLRGLIRVLPEASEAFTGTLSPGPFDRLAADHHVLVNGGDARIDVAPGKKTLVARRLRACLAGDHQSGRRGAAAPAGEL